MCTLDENIWRSSITLETKRRLYNTCIHVCSFAADFWLTAAWDVDKEAEVLERFHNFHLVPSNCDILHLVLIAKVLVVLAQLMVKPRGCAFLSITSSARTSTDSISASRTTSSAKCRSVKHSLFLPMVVPTTASALPPQVISTGRCQRIWPTYAVIGWLTKTLTAALLWLV